MIGGKLSVVKKVGVESVESYSGEICEAELRPGQFGNPEEGERRC
jgi:hypothetical protein